MVVVVVVVVVVVMVAFSSCVRILGKCSTIYSPLALFFFKVKISSRTLIPLYRISPQWFSELRRL